MSNLPANEILIFSLILLGAVSLSQFMPYKNYPQLNKLNLDRALKAIWILIVFVLIVAIFNIFGLSNFITKDNVFLISGVLIGLSALLASTTIMKSVENTNRIEKAKEKRELYDRRLIVYQALNKLTNENGIWEHCKAVEPIKEFNKKTLPVEFIFDSKIHESMNNLSARLENLFWNNQIEIVKKQEKIEHVVSSKRDFTKKKISSEEKEAIELRIEEKKRKEMFVIKEILRDCKSLQEKIKVELKL